MQLQHRLPNEIIDVVYFHPEDNHETRIAKLKKFFKNYRFKRELKYAFLLNFLRLSEEVERLGKNGGQAIIPGNFKRRYKRTAHTILVVVAHVYTLQSTSDVLTRSNLPSFPSIFALFLIRNYKSRSIEYNFN